MSGIHKFVIKALLLALILPFSLHALTVEGKDGWKFDLGANFMKKHTASNIKDKTAKDKFIQREKNEGIKKSTIVSKKNFVDAVKKLTVTKPSKKKKNIWVKAQGKTVFLDNGQYKCEDVSSILITREIVDKANKKVKLYHVANAKARAPRNCK